MATANFNAKSLFVADMLCAQNPPYPLVVSSVVVQVVSTVVHTVVVDTAVV